MMNRASRPLRWWTVVAISAFVSVSAAVLAANVFPDEMWDALNSARELNDSLSGLFTRQVPPQPPSPRVGNTPYADPVLTRLATVDKFAFGGVGFAGVTSQGELDYKSLMARPSALALFEELYRQGNLQGQSYALVGIHELDANRFKELVAPLKASNDEVVTQHGCIMMTERLGDVVKQIEQRKLLVKSTPPHR